MVEISIDRREVLNNTNEKYITILVCLLVGRTPIQSVLTNILRLLVILPYKLDTAVFYGIYIIIILFSIKKILSRNKVDSLLLIVFFFFIWLISFLINSQYYELYIQVGYELFLISLPCYLLARSVKNFSLLKKGLGIISFIITASIFISIFFLHNIELSDSYSQSISYLLLPAPIISASFLFEKLYFSHLANLIISIALIIFLGARGVLVCTFLFIIIKAIVKSFNRKKNIIILIVTTGFFLYLVNIYWNKVLSWLGKIIIKYNLSQRLILMLSNNTFWENESRNKLFNNSLSVIADKPILGTGIIKDRIILAGLMGEPINEAIGWYPHNFFLEVLLHFGLIVGTIFIILFIYLVIISFIRNKDKDMVEILFIFLGIGFFPLFFSGSYLDWPMFFVFLGFCINAFLRKRGKEISGIIE
jgi:O-antigen ligase